MEGHLDPTTHLVFWQKLESIIWYKTQILGYRTFFLCKALLKFLLESFHICITIYQQEHLTAKKCDWGKSKIRPKSIQIITAIEILPFKLEPRVQFIESVGTDDVALLPFSLSRSAEQFRVQNTCLDSQFPPLQQSARQSNSSLLPNTD